MNDPLGGAGNYIDKLKELNKAGSAFPIPTPVPGNAWMTLRDYFAGQALLRNSKDTNFNKDHEECIARYCYRIADAMLKERKREINGKTIN